MANQYKNFINIINLIKTFLILSLINSKDCAIYLPFKIIESELKNNLMNPSSLFKSWNNTQITSELLIGTPPQKIVTLLVSNIYELNLFENMCDISPSYYEKDKSSSYNFIKNIRYTYNNILNCSIINESIYLYTDENQINKISIKGFNIIYSDNKKEEYKSNINEQNKYEYHPNTCLNIGFKPGQKISYNIDLNFIGQIKHNKIIDKSIVKGYDFTFKFTNNNQGYLIIGEKPHEFDKNNFNEQQMLLIGSKNTKFTSDWYLEFNKIYYTGIKINGNSAYNSTFYADSSIKFDLDFGLIEGNYNYETNIKEDFFNYLIDKKICFTDELDNEYRIYYCDKKLGINYIEKYFPTLKFCLKQFGFCFNFDYKDLFKEKDDKIYFLIYFKLNDNYSSRFTFGQIFIKKYILTFNYDTKMIGFYDKNIIIESNKEQQNSNKTSGSNVAILIICSIVFVCIGFLFGKKIYEKARKKKANELIDDYDYESHDINSNSKKNILNVEMNSKYGII